VDMTAGTTSQLSLRMRIYLGDNTTEVSSGDSGTLTVTQAAAATVLRAIRHGQTTADTNRPSATGFVYFDDVVDFATDWPGAASQQLLQPSADSVDGAWTKESGSQTDMFQSIDEGSLRAFPSTSVLDSFTRANEGPPMTGWAALSSDGLKVDTNQAAPNDTGVNDGYWTTAMTDADVEAYVTIATQPAAGGQSAVWARLAPGASSTTSDEDGYLVTHRVTSADLRILRHDAGVSTTLGTWSVTMAAGDKIGIRCEGDTIEAWASISGVWALIGSVSDATYAGDSPNNKIGLRNDGAAVSTVARYDDFGGGAVPVDYIQSELGPVGSVTRFKLESGTTPGAGSREVSWEIGKNAAGGGTINMVTRVYQGGGNVAGAGTLVNTFTRNAVSDTPTIYTETISGTVTDWTDVYIEIEATQV
jgi:hypothetical protein